MPRFLLTLALLTLGLLAGCKPTRSHVSFMEPVAESEIAPADTSIVVGFDRAMDGTTIHQDSFRLEGSLSGPVKGWIVYDVVADAATFRPDQAFVPGEWITVRLTDEIASKSGKKLRDYEARFRIDPGPPPPTFQLEGMLPDAATVDASRWTDVRLTFSEALNPFSIAPSTVQVAGERSGQRVLTFENIFSGTPELRITVDRPFLAGERVSVNVTSGLASVSGATAIPARLAFRIASAGGSWTDPPALQEPSLDPEGILLLFDHDADGRDEMVTVDPSGRIALRRWDGASPPPPLTWDLPEAIRDATAADGDGDGFVDLVCLASAGDRLYLFPGRADPALFLSSPRILDWGSYSAEAVVAGGFDDDGHPDLFLSSPGQPQQGALLLRGAAEAPWSMALALPALEATGAARGGDLDGDGWTDLACPVTGNRVEVLWGGGDGAFAESSILDVGEPVTELHLASLDGDDRFDLLGLTDSEGGGAIFLTRERGLFHAQLLPAQARGRGAALGDGDGDGLLDLFLPAAGGAENLIFPGTANGSFGAPLPVLGATPARRFVLGDVDGDTVLDLGTVLATGGAEVGLGSPTSPPLSNRLVVTDASGVAGETGVSFTVVAEHDVPLDGYTIALTHDPSVATVETLTTSGTVAEQVGVELEIPVYDAGAGETILSVIFDFLPPYDGQSLPPGGGDTVAIGSMTLASGAPAGDFPLALTNGIGSPPTDSVFVTGGLSVVPERQDGTLTVLPGGGGTGALFLRGDANGDGAVGLDDGTFLQGYLGGGAAPGCLDAADVNDDGAVDAADPVYLYDYLFGVGSPPPPPFPAPGADPTSDPLGCAIATP